MTQSSRPGGGLVAPPSLWRRCAGCLADPGFGVSGYLDSRRRQKPSMEGLGGDGGEGQLGGIEQTPEKFSTKIDFSV